jgi:asparagine synthase (glutamine-hydrolysing)
MREARRAGLKVMLDGQGGDEIFAGYRASFAFRLADLLQRRRWRQAGAEVVAFERMHGSRWVAVALLDPHLPPVFRLAVRARLRGAASLVGAGLRGVPFHTPTRSDVFGDGLRRHLHSLLTDRGLPELLRYEDRNSMAHSVEARVPLLDHRLVELAFSLPGDELIRDGETKSVLRRALADFLPPVVRSRRDKLGFVTPEARFFRGRLGELAADVFASKSFADRGFVDVAAARRRLERHRRGRVTAGFELWRALSLELWARTFLDSGA